MLQENSELTELFALESSEELLERFACALLQTYSCSHNRFTPEQQVRPRLLSTAQVPECLSQPDTYATLHASLFGALLTA